ncbi:hypothetical protein QQP08_007568 [Theobroma cacao]|nr:hypothetical protein QQP08_007568 [Theobroma cacao]
MDSSSVLVKRKVADGWARMMRLTSFAMSMRLEPRRSNITPAGTRELGIPSGIDGKMSTIIPPATSSLALASKNIPMSLANWAA